jgi:hypothetical protein
MSEILNPENSFVYQKESKELFTYLDSLNNKYFLLLEKQISKGNIECKIGWINEANQPMYEPSLPENIIPEDDFIRGNTVCKIFIEEVLPLCKDRRTKILFNCINDKSLAFTERVLEKFVDSALFQITKKDREIIIFKK